MVLIGKNQFRVSSFEFLVFSFKGGARAPQMAGNARPTFFSLIFTEN
jgi:hypothetical protein